MNSDLWVQGRNPSAMYQDDIMRLSRQAAGVQGEESESLLLPITPKGVLSSLSLDIYQNSFLPTYLEHEM